MENTGWMKRALAVLFIVVLTVGFIKNDAVSAITAVSLYLSGKEAVTDDGKALTMDAVEKDFSENSPFQSHLINLNGIVTRTLNMSGFYSSAYGMYITDDCRIITAEPETTTDYEYESLVDFAGFLNENGISMLYVNEPVSYLDDSIFAENFSVECYSNRNADKLLERLRAAGINTIDLRENIREEGLDPESMFYRTDHHWTVPTGLWASRIMAEGLNKYCGFNIDLSIYDEDKYSFTTWEKCWLGEQGRLVGVTRVGLDDFTEVKPDFPTDYTFKDLGYYRGTFDNFIDESYYTPENDVYKNMTWHYSYYLHDVINNNVSQGKVLMLVDSYNMVTEPFVSLGVHETDKLDLRSLDMNSFDLRQYILDNGYDAVLICYAEFMIGAHDDPESYNYNTFTFA